MTDVLAAIKAQRKFTLAMIFAAAGVAGLFFDKMSGNEFYLLALCVMGAYGAANVMEKR